MTRPTEQLRAEIAEHVRALPDAEILDLVRGHLLPHLSAAIRRKAPDSPSLATETARADAAERSLAAMTTARDALSVELTERLDEDLKATLAMREHALGCYARETSAGLWARTWKAGAKMYRERWQASLDREAKLKRAVPAARLVVPTDFDGRERRRMASGIYELEKRIPEADDEGQDPDDEADDAPAKPALTPPPKVARNVRGKSGARHDGPQGARR